MPYAFYKVLHFVGIAMILVSMGALIFNSLLGGGRNFQGRRWVLVTHGLGMFVTLVAGFGLLARLNIHTPWPLWIWGKMTIWLILGGGIALIIRKPNLAKAYWILLILIVGLAAYLANLKPS